MTIPNLNPDYEALLRELAAQVPGNDAMDVEMDDVDYGEEPEQDDVPGAAVIRSAISRWTVMIAASNGRGRASRFEMTGVATQ